MGISERIKEGKASISVCQAWVCGLPIALAFAKKVVGLDINRSRVEMMKRARTLQGLSASDFEGCNIEFTSNPEDLRSADFHIVAVPTPINPSQQPELAPF